MGKGIDYPPLEECLAHSGGSVYKLALMIAKRAQELAEGAKSSLEGEYDKDRPLKQALREIVAGRIEIVKEA